MQAILGTCDGLARKRRELTGAHLATPMLVALHALEEVLEHERWGDVRQDVVEVYVEWMLCRSLIRLVEQALSAEALEKLPPAAVQEATLLLLRDMFRHHASWIQTRAADERAALDRVDELFDEVAARAGLILPRSERFPLEDVCDDAWATGIVETLGVYDPAAVARLFVWHAAVTAGVKEGSFV